MSKILKLIFAVLILAITLFITGDAYAFHVPRTVCGRESSFLCLRNGTEIRTCDRSQCDGYDRKDPEPLCKRKGFTFPIPELDGCKDYFSCRSYCGDPANQAKCTQFGKDKGITAQEIGDMDAHLGLNKDKSTKDLPCSDAASCKKFCDQKQNFDTCNDFARANKLVGGFIDNPANVNVINKAKDVLGCSTPLECASICDKAENQSKCTGFAGNVGLAGGQIQVGPGGCKSGQTCQEFCKIGENAKECASFGYKDIGTRKEPQLPIGGDSKKSSDQTPGPGGCKSEQECISYCTKNYTDLECQKNAGQYYSGNQQPGPGGCKSEAQCTDYCTKNYNDSECQKYTEQYGFKGPGGCSTQDSCTAYCTGNYTDSECQKYSSTYGFSGPGGCSDQASCTSYCTSNYQDAECQKYSGQYGGFSGPGGCKTQDECTAYCQSNYNDPECATYGGGALYEQYKKQYEDQYEQQKKDYEQQYEQQKQQYEQQKQQSEQQKQQQQQSGGESQQYGGTDYFHNDFPIPGVQGISTNRGLLQIILDLLK